MENRNYVVHYRDHQSNNHELRTAAKDSYEAKLKAMEALAFIHNHPNCIDSISIQEKETD